MGRKAQFTEEQILAIRDAPESTRVLAERYSVSHASIQRIKKRVEGLWACKPGEENVAWLIRKLQECPRDLLIDPRTFALDLMYPDERVAPHKHSAPRYEGYKGFGEDREAA